MKTDEYLMHIPCQEKKFDALYRSIGAIWGLPDCAMWILYYLSLSEDGLSQQDLIEKMMFPKQTINSAVTIDSIEIIGAFENNLKHISRLLHTSSAPIRRKRFSYQSPLRQIPPPGAVSLIHPESKVSCRQ